MENNFIKHHFEFDDFDQFAEMVSHGDLDHAQLDPGKFKGVLSQIIHGPIIIGRHKMNRIILQQGVGLDGYTNFIIPGNMEQKISWRGHVLNGNHIGILKSGMEHKSVTVSNFFGTPVSLTNEYLDEMSVLLGFPEFMNIIRRSEVIEIHKKDAIKIQEMIIGLCNAKIFNKTMFTDELPKLIIQSISQIDKPDQKGFYTSPNRIFRRAQDYIQANIHEQISILDLSKEIGISERNLRYVFTNKIGFGPKNYIHNLKLNKIRKELNKRRDEKVNVLANNYGFWHAGKFAADYKKLFGELPSETKK